RPVRAYRHPADPARHGSEGRADRLGRRAKLRHRQADPEQPAPPAPAGHGKAGGGRLQRRRLAAPLSIKDPEPMNMQSHPINFADPSLHTQGLYIGGKWEAGAGISVVDPSTGDVLGEVPDASIEDALRAVDAAEAAAAGWRATPPRQRSEILRRWFHLMTQHAEELATLISLENGKALPDARGEVAYAAEFFRWYAEEATRIPGEHRTTPSGSHTILVEPEPIGISLLITPWNFPAAMATRKIGPALAAGCTVILKPASETPLTAYAMAHLGEEAGVPAGDVNVLTTTKPGPLTSAVLADPRVRKLSFTGSTAVGRLLLAEAAKSVVSYTLRKQRRQARAAPWSWPATRASSCSPTPTPTPPSTARWSPRSALREKPAPPPIASTTSLLSMTPSWRA